MYSADVPMDQTDVADQRVSRPDECGKKARMGTFKEADTNGKITPILGDKVLVEDIESTVDHNGEAHPNPFVIVLKASHTPPVRGTTTETRFR